MYVSKRYRIEVAEINCREINEQFGRRVFNDLMETIVEETEATFHNAYDHEPSDMMCYLEYKKEYDGLPLPASLLGSEPGRWWTSYAVFERIEKNVDKLYGPIFFDCYEDSFEVDE